MSRRRRRGRRPQGPGAPGRRRASRRGRARARRHPGRAGRARPHRPRGRSRFDAAWLDQLLAGGRRHRRPRHQPRRPRRRAAAPRCCDVVDDAELSSFKVPAIVDRSPLIVAISSSGAAPCAGAPPARAPGNLAGPRAGPAGRAGLAAPRPHPRRPASDLGQRRRFYDWLLDGPAAAWLRKQRPDEAEAATTEALERPGRAAGGRRDLVGAGLGDPAPAHAFKALRALQRSRPDPV